MTPVSLYNTGAGFPLAKEGLRLVSTLNGNDFDAHGAACEFVRARRTAGWFEKYPGNPPPDLDAAYRCQDEAIALWNDRIAGWKVGWIAEEFSEKFGAQRLVGPIFERSVTHANGAAAIEVPVFARGFAAIEAEFVFQLAKDAPANVSDWTAETARRFVDGMFVGIEIASSPLKNINDFGPAVVASDFGNNAGLLVGPQIKDWQVRALDSLRCEARIDGAVVGRGTAASVGGGPLSALAFALRCNARRGRPLHAGDYVTTGAATGVHEIRVGQSVEVRFDGLGTLRCLTVPMTPVT
jgi:2-keto-4-pentenoate hydratase